MTLSKKKIDDLDRKIILELQKDARALYKDIAIKLNTSKSTISNRVKRLINAGILKLEARVDPFQIDNKVAAVIGVNLKDRGHLDVTEKIKKIPGVTSVWIASGKYDLFVEVMADSITDLTKFILIEGLDKLGVINSESFILLHSNTKYFKLY